jgi:hypothetical protein
MALSLPHSCICRRVTRLCFQPSHAGIIVNEHRRGAGRGGEVCIFTAELLTSGHLGIGGSAEPHLVAARGINRFGSCEVIGLFWESGSEFCGNSKLHDVRLQSRLSAKTTKGVRQEVVVNNKFHVPVYRVLGI